MLTKKNIALALSFIVVFVAGGWFFTALPGRHAPLETENAMLAGVAAEEAEALGDAVTGSPAPEPSLPISAAALAPDELPVARSSDIPSQLSKIDVEGIAGVVSRASQTEEDGSASGNAAMAVVRSGAKVGTVPDPSKTNAQNTSTARMPQDTSISLIEAPVVHRLIKTADEYKKFKTKAKGSYPKADFSKEMLVVLESNSNLPDKVFEIESAQVKNGVLEVEYRVNVFGLDQKINTHAVKTVKKTNAPVELKQVL